MTETGHYPDYTNYPATFWAVEYQHPPPWI